MNNSAIIVADFQTSLAVKLAVGATTGALQSNLDDDGIALPTGDYYFTIDGDSAQKEHIKCVNTAGNLTAIYSVSRQGTLTSGTVREHRVGATVTITDYAHIKVINDFVNQYDGRWMGAVANFAALPQLATDGEARVTLDDSKLYVYDLDTTTWNLAGAGGGAGTVYITTLLGTESTGDDNKTFTLTSGSFPDKKYLQVYKNGVLMSEGATNDYIAGATNTAVFNDVVLDDDVITLLVVSVDLYNPAWSQVNADIISTADATYSIGSALKKFTTGFFSGIMTALSYLGDGSTLDDSTNGKLTSGTTANKLLRLDANAKIPAVDGSQITNLPALGEQILTASDALKISSDIEKGVSLTSSYQKIKEISLKIPGTVRVSFDIARQVGSSTTVRARVYLNGSAVGVERLSTSQTYATYTEDFTIPRTTIENLVQIYGYSNSGSVGDNLMIRNFRISFTPSVSNGAVTLA